MPSIAAFHKEPSMHPIHLSRLLVLALALAAADPRGSIAQHTSAPPPALSPSRDVGVLADSLDRVMPDMLRELRIPGAAVAVIQDGRVAVMRGYGYADLERRIPVTPATGFSVGSISKAVTAWGVMRLVDQGKLELDAPVERYLTRWHLPPSEFDASGVTVRRLLSHTAGLSVSGYRGWDHADSVPSLEASLAGRSNGAGEVRIVAPPGAGWAYSGGGYTLLQLLVEEVTGRRFADYMRDEVLRPLGMTSSSFDLRSGVLRTSAVPYGNLGEPMGTPRFAEEAAAGLHTTLEDMARFAAALLPGSGTGDAAAGGVLRRATLEAMLVPAPGTEERWGLGHAFSDFPDGVRRVGHDGGNRGWQASLWVGRDAGDGIIVLTNASQGWNAGNRVFEAWMTWKTGVRRPVRAAVAAALLNALHDGGANAAASVYARLKATRADDYFFDERQLNGLGYALLAAGRTREAVTLFELNVREYPDAWNPWDSLGDGYAAAGDPENAVRAYRRSLELNPENQNAQRMLRTLSP
jgi:CubicO group peptidase (beta-lactamase class C family)